MERINLFPTTVGKFNLLDYTDWVAKRYEHHMFNEGLTGDDLVDAEITGQQLLNDPKFADIGNVAVREDEEKDADIQDINYLLNSDDPKERSLGVSKLSGALNNDNFKERIRRKIDTGFKEGTQKRDWEVEK